MTSKEYVILQTNVKKEAEPPKEPALLGSVSAVFVCKIHRLSKATYCNFTIRLKYFEKYYRFLFHVVEYNCNQQRSSADEIVYFQNEEYPQSGENPTLCLFSIPVVDDTICQIR